ncbi:hypothetical protein [Microbulbifer hydrolyticus]|uniref:Uncharacterized protein n=1 Tax=Microbulbifer hydrolyticus TaxID=48074 RepID=A0AA89PTN9_9GAMM|nr:hypothetical protein [Microbulbifer hydrolyticus]MBB5210887.1 hypothetical protein [Microbulbifer hydrolyticus]
MIEDNESCPHCGSLTDSELLQLLEEIEKQQSGNRRIGIIFGFAAAIVLAILLASAL